MKPKVLPFSELDVRALPGVGKKTGDAIFELFAKHGLRCKTAEEVRDERHERELAKFLRNRGYTVTRSDEFEG